MSGIPPGAGDFMRGMFGDLLKMLRTDSPVQWDLAVQLARSVAAEGAEEGNVDPMERIRFEELLAISDLHVGDIIGMTTVVKGPLRLVPTTRVEWTTRSLAAWRPFLEKLAEAVAVPSPGEVAASGTAIADPLGELPDELAGDDPAAQLGQMIGQWVEVMAPAMLGMQIGSIVGHLALLTFGQYELPLPRDLNDDLLIVPSNVKAFADDWSLPPDDVRMWVCLSEITHHAILSRPHVVDRLEMLLIEHARGFRLDPKILESRLEGTDLSDFSALARLLGDTPALGQVSETPELRYARLRLDTLTALIGGYAEYVTESAAKRLVGSYDAVREAMRRRRVERDEEERAAEALFGLRLGQDRIDRGVRFVRGVLERGGDAELAKLWVVESNLPTPAELEAPGLWIERVNLPIEEPSPATWINDLGLEEPDQPGE